MWRVLFVLVVVAGLCIGCTQPSGEPTPTPTATAAAATPSGSDDFAAMLARHLSETGAVLYGTYWDSGTASQKALFGDAFEYVNYIDCDPEGLPGDPVCPKKPIRGYPTWEIDGQLHQAVLSLEELAELSGFALSTP